jgi:hypothetical protein
MIADFSSIRWHNPDIVTEDKSSKEVQKRPHHTCIMLSSAKKRLQQKFTCKKRLLSI